MTSHAHNGYSGEPSTLSGDLESNAVDMSTLNSTPNSDIEMYSKARTIYSTEHTEKDMYIDVSTKTSESKRSKSKDLKTQDGEVDSCNKTKIKYNTPDPHK